MSSQKSRKKPEAKKPAALKLYKPQQPKQPPEEPVLKTYQLQRLITLGNLKEWALHSTTSAFSRKKAVRSFFPNLAGNPMSGYFRVRLEVKK